MTEPIAPLKALEEDHETRLLRQVVSLGMLLKVLLFLGSLVVAIESYQLARLDKLMDHVQTLREGSVELNGEIKHLRDTINGNSAEVARLNSDIAHLVRIANGDEPPRKASHK